MDKETNLMKLAEITANLDPEMEVNHELVLQLLDALREARAGKITSGALALLDNEGYVMTMFSIGEQDSSFKVGGAVGYLSHRINKHLYDMKD